MQKIILANEFSNIESVSLRGLPLHSGAFKSDKPFINCVSSQERLDSFVVAPLKTHIGRFALGVNPKVEAHYPIYTTYAVDEKTLGSWLTKGLIDNIAEEFDTREPLNIFNKDSAVIFQTGADARECAMTRTENSQNQYYKDYSLGELKGLTSWQSVNNIDSFMNESTLIRPAYTQTLRA